MTESEKNIISGLNYVPTVEEYQRQERANLWHLLAKNSILPAHEAALSYASQRPLLRQAFRTLGSDFVAKDIQSPSFIENGHSESNNRIPCKTPREFDYKRSRHPEAANVEEVIWKTCVGEEEGRVVLCSSGMSAVLTVAMWLNGDVLDKSSRILFGDSCYYESKIIYRNLFGTRCQNFEDSSIESVVEALHTYKPQALFLDSISTGLKLNCLDIGHLLEILALEYTAPITIIVDATCGLDASILARNHLPQTISLVVVESLAKYYQFGLDTVTGGIVWMKGNQIKTSRLDRYREYCGTNIPDSHILAQPFLAAAHTSAQSLVQTQQLRLQRLKIQEKNAFSLATALSNVLKSTVYYPRLNASLDTSSETFGGSLVTVVPPLQYTTAHGSWELIQRCIEQARRQNSMLVGGVSFGFDVTRIYPSNLNPDSSQYYLRIALGIESPEELDQLRSLFVTILKEA